MKQQWFELSDFASPKQNQCSPVGHSPHPSLLCLWKKVKLLSRVRLCNPMDCSLQGSSIHGIFQARILGWVAISFPRRSSWPRDWPRVSHIVGRHFTVWATREAIVPYSYTIAKSSWGLEFTITFLSALWIVILVEPLMYHWVFPTVGVTRDFIYSFNNLKYWNFAELLGSKVQ